MSLRTTEASSYGEGQWVGTWISKNCRTSKETGATSSSIPQWVRDGYKWFLRSRRRVVCEIVFWIVLAILKCCKESLEKRERTRSTVWAHCFGSLEWWERRDKIDFMCRNRDELKFRAYIELISIQKKVIHRPESTSARQSFELTSRVGRRRAPNDRI